MVAHRIGEYEQLHHGVARGKQSQHEQAHEVQPEAKQGQRQAAKSRQRRDDQHAHHSRQLPGNLQQAPLHGVYGKDTLEVIGDDGSTEAPGNGEQEQRD